ncbi:MAG: hypothetical protein IPG50_09120 [Myxococcales bacterium]|nr:hypothetical protein [Myxococcales bacterium]
MGCAVEQEPINQVKPHALDKTFFVGANLRDAKDDPEFYYRNTVVDVPYGLSNDSYSDSFLFTPAAADTNRIKWEITEGALLARQTYERFENADGKGTKRTNDGQIVAAFPILSHFDIQRKYNPATGAEDNVIMENVTDRPWYDRQYLRVDWSKNLVTDGYLVDTLAMAGMFGGVKYDPIQYDVRDPESPDAPHFDMNDGYFDVTAKAFAAPQTLDFDWGSIPACYAIIAYAPLMHPAVNCNPTEITLRLSFHKVQDRDFEPTDWDGNRAQAFGWITTQRYGYERNYGLVDQRWHHLAMKYNIWEKSHIEGSQCAVDFWRDEDGRIARVQGQRRRHRRRRQDGPADRRRERQAASGHAHRRGSEARRRQERHRGRVRVPRWRRQAPSRRRLLRHHLAQVRPADLRAHDPHDALVPQRHVPRGPLRVLGGSAEPVERQHQARGPTVEARGSEARRQRHRRRPRR